MEDEGRGNFPGDVAMQNLSSVEGIG